MKKIVSRLLGKESAIISVAAVCLFAGVLWLILRPENPGEFLLLAILLLVIAVGFFGSAKAKDKKSRHRVLIGVCAFVAAICFFLSIPGFLVAPYVDIHEKEMAVTRQTQAALLLVGIAYSLIAIYAAAKRRYDR